LVLDGGGSAGVAGRSVCATLSFAGESLRATSGASFDGPHPMSAAQNNATSSAAWRDGPQRKQVFIAVDLSPANCCARGAVAVPSRTVCLAFQAVLIMRAVLQLRKIQSRAATHRS